MSRQGARVPFWRRASVLTLGVRSRPLAKARRVLPMLEANVRNQVIPRAFSKLNRGLAGSRFLHFPCSPSTRWVTTGRNTTPRPAGHPLTANWTSLRCRTRRDLQPQIWNSLGGLDMI